MKPFVHFRKGDEVMVERVTGPGCMRCTVAYGSHSGRLCVVTAAGVVISIYPHDAHRVKPVDAITQLGELLRK